MDEAELSLNTEQTEPYGKAAPVGGASVSEANPYSMFHIVHNFLIVKVELSCLAR